MKQFRVVWVDYNLASDWLNQAEWTIKDLEQFKHLGNYYVEYR